MVIVAATVGSDLFRGLLQGIPPGVVYALVALGFVLTYKTSGVFNLAFGAQAYVSAAMYFKARVVWGWGTVPSVILAVFILAPAPRAGARTAHLPVPATAPEPIAKLVAAIGLAVAIPALFDILAGFEAIAGQTPVGVVTQRRERLLRPVRRRTRSAATSSSPWAPPSWRCSGLAALFRFSAIGLRMRAVVESPRMTELNGINAERVSAFAWMLSSLFAGVAGVLIAPRFNTLSAGDFFNLVVVAIAAAAIGRLASLPMALAGGLGLGVLIAEINTFLPALERRRHLAEADPGQPHAGHAVPRAVRRAGASCRASDGATTPATRSPASTRHRAPLGAAAAGPAQASASPGSSSGVLLVLGALGRVHAGRRARGCSWSPRPSSWPLIFLSITVITGMAGQISLCQGAFAAIGAFTVFQMVDRATTCRCSSPRSIGARHRRRRRPPSCRCRSAGSAGCGSPSPRWPSPTSSTR